MAKTTLTVDVEYEAQKTDPEALACAMDRLMETILSTPGIFDEYGNPRVGEFFVADAAGNPPRPRPMVVAEISGGVLQEAYSSDDTVKLVLIDHDTEGCKPEMDNGIVEITDEDGRTQCLLVTEFPTTPIAELSDTAVGMVLEKAGVACPNEPDEDLVRQRWVVYDLDTDELLTTRAYSNYRQALRDVGDATDVLVLPIVCRGMRG